MRPERTLNINGSHNFRDMGGYQAADGRTVRWATLYRSGVMSKIDPGETAALKALGIVSICDLRTTSERRNRPTVWHQDLPVEMLARDYEMSAGVIKNLIKRKETTGAEMAEHMHAVYRDLLEEQAEGYRTLFRRLVEGRVPLVFNCAAGKDRTGIAAALILCALGVSHEDVVEDYTLTNASIEGLVELLRHEEDYRNWFEDQPESAYPLLRAEPLYLEGMFRELEGRFGGLHAYLADMMELTPADIATMRDHLLE